VTEERRRNVTRMSNQSSGVSFWDTILIEITDHLIKSRYPTSNMLQLHRMRRRGDLGRATLHRSVARSRVAARAIQIAINAARGLRALSARSSSGGVRHATRPFAAASVGITAFAIWANGSAHERVSRASPSPSPSSAFTGARLSRHFASGGVLRSSARGAIVFCEK